MPNAIIKTVMPLGLLTLAVTERMGWNNFGGTAIAGVSPDSSYVASAVYLAAGMMLVARM